MAVDMFLQIADIPGESTDDAHGTWIDVLDYHIGVTNPEPKAAGRADFAALTLIKRVDTSSPDLNIFCAKATNIPEIVMEIRLASGDKVVFMKYTLENCTIASVNVRPKVDAAELRPTEEVAIVYNKIKWEALPVDIAGAAGSPVDRTWDVAGDVQV